MTHQCNKCDKTFKTKRGLDKHIKTCDAIKEDIGSEEVVETIKLKADSEYISKKMKKLKDAMSSTMDAEARHKLQLEIKRLSDI